MALCCVMMFMVAFGGGGGVAFSGVNEGIVAQIVRGEIVGICRCVYVNIGSEYPKAWVLNTIVY